MATVDVEVREKIKRVLVIDDSYAPVEVRDLEGEAITRFANALMDKPRRPAQVAKALGRTSLDPRIPKDIEEITENQEALDKLWALKDKRGWAWIADSLFEDYQQKAGDKGSELEQLETVLGRFKWQVERRHIFDPKQLDVGSWQLIFLDFYLKDETLPDASLRRAVELGQEIVGARHMGKLGSYPIVVLMSSRTGADESQEEFKRRTGLRGDFFCFLKKDQIESAFESKFGMFLSGYKEKQALAHLLDEYWLAAMRAATQMRADLALVEPTELALLHEAELGVEEAVLPDYLSWLVSESVSAKLLGDDKLLELRGKLPALVERSAFPGFVPPSSRIADMYVRSIMRLDINDAVEATKAFPIAMGDLFARVGDSGEPLELLLVVDQSCDLARPANKKSVLCLQCQPTQITDVALAFYRTTAFNSDGKGDLIPLQVNGQVKYFLAKWDMVNPTTPTLNALVQREGKLRRIARYKSLIALARQELLTQQVGRIGEPVIPPNAIAYKAKLILHNKDGSRKEFDASKENWASVVIVQGRHLEMDSLPPEAAASKSAVNTEASAQGEVAGKSAAKPKKVKGAKVTSSLSFTSDYSEWLAAALTGASLSDTQTSSKRDILVKRIADGGVQRIEMKPLDPAASDKTSEQAVWKAQADQLLMHAVFGKSVPDSAKTSPIVLLLTPYEGTVRQPTADG